jgi:raffinose/stachyose/melibiose transport system permease protein
MTKLFQSGRTQNRLPQYLALLLVAGLVIIPLYATAVGGLKSVGELRTNPFGLPSTWIWRNYWNVLADPQLWQLLFNSALIAGVSVVLTLLLASMSAFVFAHITFLQQHAADYLMLGLMFPAATAILPLFIKIRDFGLLDSAWGVILPQVAFGLGFSIVLLRGFFKQLPGELWEAARMDRCSYARFYWSITLPLSRPILATVAVFTLVSSWNNYLLPLVGAKPRRRSYLAAGIMRFQGHTAPDWPLVLHLSP